VVKIFYYHCDQLLERFFKISSSKKDLCEKTKDLLKEPFLKLRFLKQELHFSLKEVLGIFAFVPALFEDKLCCMKSTYPFEILETSHLQIFLM